MITISGIYYILNTINNKKYVGSALNIGKRWSEHRSDLKYNKHDNPYLQNAWNKYGESNFKFCIVENILQADDLIIREQFYLDKFHSYDDRFGYNIRKKAESNLGLKHKKETKEFIRQANIGKHNHDGINNPFFGKHHTDDTRIKMKKERSSEACKNMSIAAKKRGISKQAIEASVRSRRGKPAWNKGKILVPRQSFICGTCGIEFIPKRNTTAKFCSRKCAFAYGSQVRWGKDVVKKI